MQRKSSEYGNAIGLRFAEIADSTMYPFALPGHSYCGSALEGSSQETQASGNLQAAQEQLNAFHSINRTVWPIISLRLGIGGGTGYRAFQGKNLAAQAPPSKRNSSARIES